MSTPAIRAALERLVELDGHLNETSPGWMQAWSDAIAAARAALAAEPVGEGPTEALVDDLFNRFADFARWAHPDLVIRAAPPAPEEVVPVALSERLPGEGDCDTEGRCWLLHVDKLGLLEWHFLDRYPSLDSYSYYGYTHWLPASAIPLPQAGEASHG
jgi:hypothetical protein